MIAAAYSNSLGKPEKTAMYDIDTRIGALIRQTSPNNGTSAATGKPGITLNNTTPALDIQTTEDGTNTAWLVAEATIYSVNLETGAALSAGVLKRAEGDLINIRVMPAI